MNQEDSLLDYCLTRIEEKTGWGPAAAWTNQDFTELSVRIADATGIHLSATTLKRVWGRVAYASKPSPTTLDALADFAGFDNWRALRLAAQDQPDTPANGQADATEAAARRPAGRYRYVLLAAGLAAAVLAFLLSTITAPASAPKDVSADQPALHSADFSFNFRPVASGVPNSVVFTYDATAAPAGDTIYLQQNWDRSRRVAIPRDERVFTSIYYLPGFFRAKLLVGDQIVKERDVYIRSEGWVALADHAPVPVYLPLDEVQQNGRLAISTGLLGSHNIPLQPETPEVGFTHVGALDGLYSDDFTFRTRLRHDYAAGSSVCQQIRVVLLLKNDAIIIPLSRLGCAAELQLLAGGQSFDGRTTDLSAFGVVAAEQWIDLACTGSGDLLTFSINGRQVFTVERKDAPKEFVGIRYEFSGTGSVDELAFSNAGGVVWEEDF